jgi:hypothetical protein
MTLSRVHASAAPVATRMIALFFSSTVVVEATGDHRAIAWVKSRIVAPTLFVLVPALTDGSGFMLSRGWRSPLVARKKRRMPVIAGNGLLILVPVAVVLDQWAAAGAFDARFCVVQAVVLLAGGTNLTPDGPEHAGRAPAERAAPTPAT